MKHLSSVLLNVLLIKTTAFVAPNIGKSNLRNSNCRDGTARYSSWGDLDPLNAEGPAVNNMVRTCVKNFLTQRSFQSFLFLLDQCRDSHTAEWIEQEVLDRQNLLSFHGTGGFDLIQFPTWDSALLHMLEKPMQVVVVRVQRRNPSRTGGLGGSPSKNKKRKRNPYLQEQEEFFEFEIDVDPVSLVSRIVSVREQLAKEWVKDFDIIIQSNERILKCYFELSVQARNDEHERSEHEDYDSSIEADAHPEYNLDPLASLTAPYSSRKRLQSPDSKALKMYLGGNIFEGGTSSPLRKGNFDLMLLLATQESIHRVLNKYRDIGPDKEVSFKWLRTFYIERIEEYFDGNQAYNRADDFLEELLLTPPSITTMDGVMGLTDPFSIATDIIAMRGEVAGEWKDTVSEFKHDHMELRKELYTKMMAKYEQPTLQARSEMKDGTVGAFE